jgi:hypothetical protein
MVKRVSRQTSGELRQVLSSNIAAAPAAALPPQGSAVLRRGLAREVSIGVLSYGAQATLARSLETHKAAGLPDLAGEFFVYFNALCDEDVKTAGAAGVPYHGDASNTGIYGGFRRIAEHATKPYVLILENDIVSNPQGADAGECLESCVADMIEHRISTFSLRSRTAPGQGGVYGKYLKCFPVREPLTSKIAPQALPLASRLGMYLKHGHLGKFRAGAIYAEKHPEQAQPAAITRLPSGNFLTQSRFRNWSNQAVLVERSFFLDVICRRVDEHPDPRLINGCQDIERAINRWWWRRLGVRMGHARDGIFTHAR